MKIGTPLLAGMLLGMIGATAVVAPREKAALREAAARTLAARAEQAKPADDHGEGGDHGGEVAPADDPGSDHPSDATGGTPDAAPGDAVEGSHASEDASTATDAPAGSGSPSPGDAETGPEDEVHEADTTGAEAAALPQPGGAGALTSVPGPGAPDPTGSRKLARIFGAMKATDAAAVLEMLSDEEIQQIILNLKERPAAQILGNFEPDRAARLSRRVMRPGA